MRAAILVCFLALAPPALAECQISSPYGPPEETVDGGRRYRLDCDDGRSGQIDISPDGTSHGLLYPSPLEHHVSPYEVEGTRSFNEFNNSTELTPIAPYGGDAWQQFYHPDPARRPLPDDDAGDQD